MVLVTDAELIAHAPRIHGKVLVITGISRLPILISRVTSDLILTLALPGGGSGIGREIALLYANYGYISLTSSCNDDIPTRFFCRAKVVIGDIDQDAANGVVYEITDSGG